MKKSIFATSIVMSAILWCNAQPPAGDAAPGDHYGAAFKKKSTIAITTLPAKLKNEKPVPVQVTARVLDVCPKKGCWIQLEVNDSTTAFVKMKDYSFFLPVAVKGKTIVIDGDAFVKTTTVKELQHYAEDAKKSKEEIAAITAPKKEIQLIARGIEVVNK